MSIRSKFRVVSLCIVAILVGVVLAGWWVAGREITKKVHSNLNLVADLQLERVQDVLDRNFERLEQVSSRRPLQDNMVRFVEDSVEDSRDKVSEILRDAKESVDTFKEVAIISAEGVVLGSSNFDNIDTNYEDMPFFLGRQKPGEVSEDGRAVSFEVGEDGELTVVLSKPFIVEEEELGIVVIVAEGANLAAPITHETETQSLITVLVKTRDDGGMEILTPPEVVNEVREIGIAKAGEGGAPPIVRAANGEEDFYYNAIDYRGVPVLARTRYFPGLKLGFVAKLDRREAFQSLARIRNILLIALALALVALELVFFAIQRSMLKPLQHLAGTATKISKGDLSQRSMEMDRSDEIGELARDLNQMTEALVDANAGLERKVEERTAELERSNAELAQFAYIASHDLREPLRMITCYVQLLERRYKDNLDEEAFKFISYAVDGSARMRRLIDDLLAFSRVGTRAKEFAEVELAEIFEAVKMNLKIAIEESEAEVVSGKLPRVKGDSTQLTQLLQNLIANAIKFRGDRKPRVEVSAEEEDGIWRLAVQDNGIGIEESHQERIFLIFQRLHNRDEYEGTGIGLAVCKKIVERHGGKIEVKSVAGEGSRFMFTIPVFAKGAAFPEEPEPKKEAPRKEEVAAS